jgi:hypothetical protein
VNAWQSSLRRFSKPSTTSGADRLFVTHRYRILFAYAADGAIEALFIEERALVYELFEAEFVKKLKG